MAGIYLHIPFCKQKCHYCDFHFSTKLEQQEQMVAAICKELVLRKSYLKDQEIETVYFGGGTPSLLSKDQVKKLLSCIHENFLTDNLKEITLEANPDDLSEKSLYELSDTGLNRLSIGIQSFDEDVLKFMNRAHNSEEAISSIRTAQKFGFKNLTADLIYGIPNKDLTYWKHQVQKMIELGVQHVSAYCLTLEQNTVFRHLETKGEFSLPEDEESLAQFNYLVKTLFENGYEQYEISNFAKKGFISKHNSAYWKGKWYLGVGPSAHSYNGRYRSWNVRNNIKYQAEIAKGIIPEEQEQLTAKDIFNDYVLTRLRTKWGLNKKEVQSLLEEISHPEFESTLNSCLKKGFIQENETAFILSAEGKFIADKLAADLFV